MAKRESKRREVPRNGHAKRREKEKGSRGSEQGRRQRKDREVLNGIRNGEDDGDKALRPFWSGTISFGLVSVPVDLYPATRNGRLLLRLLSPEGAPLSRRYYCPEDQEEVDNDHLVRGYPIEDGTHLVIEDEELEALAPQKSRDIDLTRFVPREQIAPEYFERAYFLAPSGDSNKAYRLLTQIMSESSRAGIASFVMRGKEYLVAIIAENGILRAETLKFQEELRDVGEIGLQPVEVHSHEVAKMAELLHRHMRNSIPEHILDDHVTEKLRAIVEEKLRRGKDVVKTAVAAESDEEEETPGDRVDLLVAIRRALSHHDDRGRTSPHRRPARVAKETYDRARPRQPRGQGSGVGKRAVRSHRRK